MSFYKDMTVLVTGGAGSIGAHLCKALAMAGACAIAFDNSELGLFNLKRAGFRNIKTVLGDITHANDVGEVFAKYRPAVVFHAAAYKHVGMCEENTFVAHRTNVGGTLNVIHESKATTMVLISTDKAVRPTCFMGRTKQIAEQLTLEASQTVIRLGNVLDSSGSVRTIWREQNTRGEPVTVTHPEATRFFIKAEDASRTIMQAGALPGAGGRVYVPSCMTLHSIMQMAIASYKHIQITELSKGEKLHEELYVGRPRPVEGVDLNEDVTT